MPKYTIMTTDQPPTILELRARQPYFGFVEHSIGHGTFRMFLGGADDAVALKLYWNGSYEQTTLKTWAALAKKCELALDIGAHTGIYTLAAKASNPDISVVAFEPSPANFYRLNLNLRANQIGTQNAFQKAVWSNAGQARFSMLSNADILPTGGMVGVAKGANVITVEAIALDEFLPAEFWPRVGMIKLDLEGCEAEAIAGMLRVIEATKPVIFFECIKAGLGVESQLKPMGYRFYEVDDEAGTIEPVAAIRPHLNSDGSPIHSKANRIASVAGLPI